jgi:hypothetical protein
VTFALDSWGYLVPPGNVPHETVGNQGTYGAKNGRFSRVAVNIVSAHGAICVTNCPTLDSVNYTLTQLGPYVTSDFAGKPHFLPAPSQIGTTPNTPGTFATQLVNGVAPDDGAERSVPWNANDPINIDAYMRSDFVGLPMSGTYELDLWPTQQAPQDFGEVTAVQLVIEPYFWTATPPAGAP